MIIYRAHAANCLRERSRCFQRSDSGAICNRAERQEAHTQEHTWLLIIIRQNPRPRPSSQLPAPLTKMETHLWSRWNPEKLPFDRKRSMAEPGKEEEEKRKEKQTSSCINHMGRMKSPITTGREWIYLMFSSFPLPQLTSSCLQ